MKVYINAEIEVINLESLDIITKSVGVEDQQGSGTGLGNDQGNADIFP